MINPLNAELNPICHFLALLEAHLILHISRIRVKTATLHEDQYVFFPENMSRKFKFHSNLT